MNRAFRDSLSHVLSLTKCISGYDKLNRCCMMTGVTVTAGICKRDPQFS